MAQIKKNDIVEDGLFRNPIEEAKELLKVLDSLDKEFMSVSNSAKAVKQNLDFGKVSDIDKFIKLEQEMAGQFRQTTELMKKRKTVQDQLRAATDEEVKGKLRLQQATAAQRKELKLELELEKAQEGTLKRLRLVNKQLREEKERLNLTTKEGKRRLREINAEINRNNAVLEKNATQLGKQKMGIGRYSEAIKKNMARFVGWTAVISLFTRALRGAARTILGFDKAQGDLRGLISKTTRTAEENRKVLDKLEKSAKKLGRTSIFTARQVSALQKEYAKLGFTGDEILNVTESTLTLAQATNTELPRAAEVVGNTLRAFQLNSNQTARVVDVMTKSFNISSLDMERFATAMGNVAPVAASAGASVERTTALLGTLTSAGIDASTAGTGLRNVFLELSKQGLTFEEAMTRINTATDKNGAALELFGKRGATVGTVLADNVEQTKEWTKELENAGGTAERVANEQMDTLSGQIKGLESAWEGFILALEDGDGVIARVVRGAIELFTELLNRLTDLTRTEADKMNDIVEDATAKNSELVGGVFQKLQEDAKKGIEELKSIRKELDALDGEERTEAIEQRIRNIDRLIEAQKDGIITTKELINIGEKTNLDFGAATAAKEQEMLNNAVEKFSKLMDEVQIDEKEVQEFNLALGTLGVSKIFTSGEIARLQQLKINVESFISDLADKATKGSASIDAYKESLRTLFRSRDIGVDDLKNIIETGTKIQREIAKFELQRRELIANGTKSDKEEGGKRVKNVDKELKRKLQLQKDYLREKRKLEEDGLEASNELEEFNIENQIELAEDEAERLKQINIERVENGFEYEEKRQIEFYQRKLELQKRYVEFLYQTQREANLKIYNEEDERIKKLEQDGLDPAKVEELKRKNQQVLEDSDTLAKQERNKKNRELDAEYLKDIEDFNKEIEDAQQKHNDEMDKLREEQQQAEEEANQKRLEQRQELFDGLEAIGQAFAEREQERINKELENIDLLLNKSRERVNQLRQNSSENRQTIESNIAFEEAKQAQLEKQRLEAEKKQRQIELATTAVEVYSNKVKNDDPNPLVNTIKDITLLQQFVKNIPLFWEGTDTTVGAALGAPHLNTARDGYIVRVDKNEKILNPHLSAMTGNMTTQEIAEAAYNYRMGITDYTNPFDLSNQSASVANVVNNNSMYLLQQEMYKYRQEQQETNDKLQELINKPVSSMFLDDTGAIPKIVQRTVQGNKTINQKRMLR